MAGERTELAVNLPRWRWGQERQRVWLLNRPDTLTSFGIPRSSWSRQPSQESSSLTDTLRGVTRQLTSADNAK